jgi:anthraniloyl-CoA monooxygenase
MRVSVVGGGPGGLYTALLLKKADPARDITVYERNRPDDTFGFGVVFSDQTLGNVEAADPQSFAAIAAEFAYWDAIDVHLKGRSQRSVGHGFAGLSRQRLLAILQARCEELGVALRHEVAIDGVEDLPPSDLVVAADGLNSRLRTQHAAHFGPELDLRPNRFTWMGSTRPLPAFTFWFKEDQHGLWRVHAYEYEGGHSTFIVEATEATWQATGLAADDQAGAAAFLEALFAEELEGHRLLTNHSVWRQFPTVRNRRWHHDNIVLVGDAAHTAHFSIGSGTKLAMEDAIALRDALAHHPKVSDALPAYETARRAGVASTQRAAQVSLEWFEETERLYAHLSPEDFTYSLLTRSLRINHENLRVRDPDFVAETDRRFAARCHVQTPTPPMFTPFKVGPLTLSNRVVVSPMCQYSATDGLPDDWHLVHLGGRAQGGAGLVIAEMTDVSAAGRITLGCAGIYTDAQQAAWARVVDYVHAHTPAKVGLQLGHAGRKGSCARPWDGDRPLSGDQAWETLAPSALPFGAGWPTPRAMDDEDLDRVRADFVSATHRAAAAGFDLLELHLAHGYLLAGFLSPLSNTRADEYGGDRARRARFPLEVFEAVRAAWPADRALSVRISGSDWQSGGATPDDAVWLARQLGERGCDLIDVSSGFTTEAGVPRFGRLFQVHFAERVRLETGLPTMTVGGVSSHGDLNSVLAAGRADLCAIARAHLFDPYWTRHAAFEQGYDLPWPSQYPLRRYTPRMEWSPRGLGTERG